MNTINIPTCRHFGSCGGCRSQDVSYENQVARKQERFQSLLQPFGIAPATIQPSESAWFYRNKMEFSFSNGPDSLSLGLKERGRWWKVVSLQECLIFDERTGAILEAMRQWARREGLAAYDPKKHTGFLRYLVLRKAESGMLAALITTSAQMLPSDSLMKALSNVIPAEVALSAMEAGIQNNLDTGPRIQVRGRLRRYDEQKISILHGTHDLPSDTALPQTIKIIFGQPQLTETLLNTPFRYSFSSFFQPNPRTFERLLSDLINQIPPLDPAPKKILDFYCGVGTISVLAHKISGLPVEAVESVPSCIEDALNNASSNGSPATISFIEDTVEKKAKELLAAQNLERTLVILDPPRAGIHPKVRKALLEHPPRHLFYVSCNPELTARQDLPHFCQNYDITFAKAYDFFPHTDHYEAFFVLKKKHGPPLKL